MFVQRTPRLGPVPRRQRRRTEHIKCELVSPTADQNEFQSTSGENPTTNQHKEQPEVVPSTTSEEQYQQVPTDETTEDIFASLDTLLDLDNAQQCLVFSPLDSLPRLDFHDLQLDLGMLERMFETPISPICADIGILPQPAPVQTTPSIMRMFPLGPEVERAGGELAIQTQQLAERLLQQMRERGLQLPGNAFEIEGILHNAAMRSAALHSAAIHSASLRTAALRTNLAEATPTPPTVSTEVNSPLMKAWNVANSRPCFPKVEETAVPSELWLGPSNQT